MQRSTVRWNLQISLETDAAVRRRLVPWKDKTSDLSQFVEDAVHWRLFDQTLQQAHENFQDLSDDELQTLVDAAVAESRCAHRPST